MRLIDERGRMTETLVACTVHGDVEGECNEGVVRFRGIPFANRIDGPGRFRSPRAPERWGGVRLARRWAPPTPQIADGSVAKHPDFHRFLFGRFYDLPMSEQELSLNLWTPSVDRGARRPVMVW